MAATKIESQYRWEITLRGPETIDEDLGFIGEYVGPRKGDGKRTQDDMEDFILRHIIVALRQTDRLDYPVAIAAERQRRGMPDFVLRGADGVEYGVKMTQAGEENLQRWLTETESPAEAGDAVLVPGDGYVPSVEINNVVMGFGEAISDKIEAWREGKYREPNICDLAVYDNSRWGGDIDSDDIVQRLRGLNALSEGFRAVHLVFGTRVYLDALGEDTRAIDTSRCYEIDFAEWLFDQAARIRREEWNGIDTAYLAEELESLGRSQSRALRSHMRNRLVHIIIWHCQPEKRSRSWYASLRNSLVGMEDQIAVSPSLGTPERLAKFLTEVYPQARRQALDETGLPGSVVAEECPYSLEEVFDPAIAGPEPETD